MDQFSLETKLLQQSRTEKVFSCNLSFQKCFCFNVYKTLSLTSFMINKTYKNNKYESIYVYLKLLVILHQCFLCQMITTISWSDY